MFQLTLEDIREAEDLFYFLKDGQRIYVERFDLVRGDVLFELDGQKDRMSIGEFAKGLNRRVIPKSLMMVFDALGRTAAKEPTPISIATHSLSEQDKKRNRAMGRTTVITDKALPDGFVRIGDGLYLIHYRESIGKQFFYDFERARLSAIDDKPKTSRDVLKLLNDLEFERSDECIIERDGETFVVPLSSVIRRHLPLLEDYLIKEDEENHRRCLKVAETIPGSVELFDRYGKKTTIDGDIAKRISPACLREAERRSYRFLSRAEEMLNDGHLLSLKANGESFDALILSSYQDSIYHATMAFDAKGKLTYSCSCPYAEEHAYCKHSLMIPLAIAGQSGDYVTYSQRRLLSLICKAYDISDPYPEEADDEEDERYGYW